MLFSAFLLSIFVVLVLVSLVATLLRGTERLVIAMLSFWRVVVRLYFIVVIVVFGEAQVVVRVVVFRGVS